MTETLSTLTQTVLPDRGILRLTGDDRVGFLQGLVSNDVTLVAPDRAVYACLLTPQGKFLHDFFLVADGAIILIECEAARRDDLLRRLKTFKLRSKVELEDVTEKYSVIALAGERPGPARPDANLPSAVDKEVAPHSDRSEFDFAMNMGIVYPDSRLSELGYRALIPKALAAVLSDTCFLTPLITYDRHRIALGVPDGSRDMEVGKAILLENNIDLLNGISWTKGCYMGQELTARTRYRGLVKKRLIPVAIEGTAPDVGAILTVDGREIGEMRTSAGDIGLALLRLDWLGTMATVTAGHSVLTPRIPPYLAPILTQPAEP